MKRIAIFLNGKHTQRSLKIQTSSVCFPFIHRSYTAEEKNLIVFAADNGFKRVLKEKIPFTKLHLFGDFDSLSETHLKQAKNNKRIDLSIFPKEKNVSDFGCILDHILNTLDAAHPFYIEIYGGLGNARDHEYTNIKEAENFLSQSKHGGTLVFQESLVLSTLPFSVHQPRETHFTLFCDSSLEFSIQNAQYSGLMKLTRPSHGLSNKIAKSPVIIERDPSHQIITLVLR